MNIAQYVRSLIPSFEKRHVLSDIRALRELIGEFTIPPYIDALPVFGTYRFSHAQLKDFEKAFERAVRSSVKGNFIHVIHGALTRANDQLNVLEDVVERHFAKDVTAVGITYRQANILRYTELLRFLAKYARAHLRLVYEGELAMRSQSGGVGKELTGPERQWLEKQRDSFFAAVAIVYESETDLGRTLANVPDVTVDTDNLATVANTIGMSKLDPRRLGRVGFNGNPIYHFRMVWEDIATAEYEAALEERRQLELRLLELEQLQQDGVVDARLQKEIEGSKLRLEKLQYKIAKRQREAEEGA